MRVSLVHRQSARQARLRTAVEDAGFPLVDNVQGGPISQEALERLLSAVLVADADSPSLDRVEEVASRRMSCLGPVLRLRSRDDRCLLTPLSEMGISAYVMEAISTASCVR